MKYQDVFRRVEKKYFVPAERYDALLAALAPYTEDDEYGVSRILNIYYDTPDDHLVRTSLAQPPYKEKLRLRCYGIPDDDAQAFLEIKKKYDKVVYKRRCAMRYADAVRFLAGEIEIPESSHHRQILREIRSFTQRYEGIKPRMVVSYDRIALRGRQDSPAGDLTGLRITFDRNMRWRSEDLDLRKGNGGEELTQPGTRLMEVKIAGAMPVFLAEILSKNRIFPAHFSKYGMAYTTETARQITALRAERAKAAQAAEVTAQAAGYERLGGKRDEHDQQFGLRKRFGRGTHRRGVPSHNGLHTPYGNGALLRLFKVRAVQQEFSRHALAPTGHR